MNATSTFSDPGLRAGVEDFLYRESDLLDSWELDSWLQLFAPDAVYEVPTTDFPEGRPEEDLFIIADTMDVLRGRVKRLKNVNAFVESPKSRTRRFVTNVRVVGRQGMIVQVTANFQVARIRKGHTDIYIGRYDHLLEETGPGDFIFRRRRALLDQDALRPHGKVSIIL